METEEYTGWICTHRKLLNNPIMRKPQYGHLWNVLLLLANHKEHSFVWNNKPVKIKAGQLLTGRQKLAKISGIKEGTVETILKYLESQQQIQQQKTTKFRIITIINWQKYQCKQNPQQQTQQRADNRLTTEQQQADTYNNNNNANNENKRVVQKKKLFPLSGKYCCKRGCGMPAVWKGGGDYDNFYCLEHSPEKVRAEYC